MADVMGDQPVMSQKSKQAPCCIKQLVIVSIWLTTEKCRGEQSLASQRFREDPCSMIYKAISSWSFAIAIFKAHHLFPSTLSMSAPCFINNFTISLSKCF